MKIVTVIGARPQFIKCAPLSRELRKEHDEILIHTGQHYDVEMSDIFFDELDIPLPDYNLGIGSAFHGEQTGRMLIEIEKILIKETPDVVLVYGDTNSTLAGALAASKLNIKVAHVEAGLRSYDTRMPEEINRTLTDHISDILFCPTQTAVDNLAKEGISEGVYMVGDIMVDSLKYGQKIADEKSKIIEKMGLEKDEYLVVTIHRPSNTDSRLNMTNIFNALGDLSMRVVFPIHPRTKKCIHKYRMLDKLPPNVMLIEPLGYLDMLKLMGNSKKILTDSGGVQKEAYLLMVPCITLRENTEWVETLEHGWNVLVGADRDMIVKTVMDLKPLSKQSRIFGDGRASEKIIKAICKNIKNT